MISTIHISSVKLPKVYLSRSGSEYVGIWPMLVHVIKIEKDDIRMVTAINRHFSISKLSISKVFVVGKAVIVGTFRRKFEIIEVLVGSI